MAGRQVSLRVGGQTYRVVTTASEDELVRLASAVDRKLAELAPPGRPLTPQTMLLAAMSFAHDVEEERARAETAVSRAKSVCARVLQRVDAVLGPGPNGLASRTPDEEPASPS